MLQKYLHALTFLAGFSLIITAILYSRPLPRAGLPDAPSQEFSSARASRHLVRIARVPHPPGTAAHAEVEEYILDEIRKLGLHPEVQDARVVLPQGPDDYSVVFVRNLIVKLPGTMPTKALLVTAHYDSVPSGPGAGDDGAAIAAMLEILRIISAERPPKNDILFLFSDGEEYGLYGARAFVEHKELAGQIGAVLNFEARGNSGPSILFETGDDNAWMVSRFMAVTPEPYATSLTSSLYKTLPNSTDLTVYKRAGIPGLNFAFAEGWNNYHSQMDTPENLDMRSLQHHGNNCVALVREFGTRDLAHIPPGSVIYFNLFGPMMVSYPTLWAVVFGVIVTCVLVAGVTMGSRRGAINTRGLALGFIYPLSCAIAGGAICWVLGAAIRNFNLSYKMRGDIQGAGYYFLAFAFCGLTCAFAIYGLLRRMTTWINVAMGSSLVWLLLMWASICFIRGSSYLFTWPLLAAAAISFIPAIGISVFSKKSLAIVTLVALPSLLLLVPAIDLLFVALTIPGAFLVAAFVGLCGGMFVPQLELLATLDVRTALRILAIAVAGLLAAGTVSAWRNARFTRADYISYVENSDKNIAAWHTGGTVPDSWTEQFFSGAARPVSIDAYLPQWFGGPSNQTMSAEAPLAALQAPEVILVRNVEMAGERRVSLRIRSPGGAPQLFARINCDGGIDEVLLEDQRLKEFRPVTAASKGFSDAGGRGVRKQLFLALFSLPEQGIELTFRTPASQDIAVSLVEKYFEIPSEVVGKISPRPQHIMIPRNGGDSTLLVKAYEF